MSKLVITPINGGTEMKMEGNLNPELVLSHFIPFIQSIGEEKFFNTMVAKKTIDKEYQIEYTPEDGLVFAEAIEEEDMYSIVKCCVAFMKDAE